MMKKIWLFFLTTFGILFLWTTFANPTYSSVPGTCTIFENVRIDNYKLVAWITKNERDHEKGLFKSKTTYYEPVEWNCIKCSWSSSEKIFLVDKSVDIKSVTEENIETISIPLRYVDTYFCSEFYVTKDLYKIIKNWGTYEAQLYKTKDLRKLIEIKKILPKFSIFWLLTIIIETSILFFITKLYYQDSTISNKKLFLFWILPTTITLPLLWFVLPLLIWDWIRYTIIWELLVTIIEAIIIKYWLKIFRKRAVITSIICNLFSFVLLSTWDLKIKDIMILLILGFLIGVTILFLARKLLLKNDEISNKRLIITWCITLIIITLSILFLLWLWIITKYNYFNRPVYEKLRLLIIAIILVKIIVDIVIIKYLLKISRKKSIIVGLTCDLCNLITTLQILYLFFTYSYHYL